MLSSGFLCNENRGNLLFGFFEDAYALQLEAFNYAKDFPFPFKKTGDVFGVEVLEMIGIVFDNPIGNLIGLTN